MLMGCKKPSGRRGLQVRSSEEDALRREEYAHEKEEDALRKEGALSKEGEALKKEAAALSKKPSRCQQTHWVWLKTEAPGPGFCLYHDRDHHHRALL